MAKIEGTQTIPSELLDLWRNNLCSLEEISTIRKRYPFRIRLLQKFGYKVTDDQKNQRERFLYVKDKFKELSDEEKTRWYSAMPQYSSLLWYYDYFIMSGIAGVLGGFPLGALVVKKVQNIFFALGLAGTSLTFPTAVDPAKAVVLIFGEGYQDLVAGTPPDEAPYVYRAKPIFKDLCSSGVSVLYSVYSAADVYLSLMIIEYI